MDRKKIEDRDKTLLKNTRAILQQKEQIQTKNMPRRLYGILLVAFLTCGFLFSMFSSKEPVPGTTMEKSSPAPNNDVNRTSQSVLTKTMDATYKIPDHRPIPPQEKHPQDLKTSSLIASADKNVSISPDVETQTISDPMAVIQESAPADTTPPKAVTHIAAKKTISSKPVESAEEKEHLPTFHIAEIVTCKRVEKRTCISPQKKFSLHDDPTPVVWMDVRSEVSPFILKHVYYFNGKKYCEVPLTIKYSRMRTWSNVTLKYPENVGQWRVEINTSENEKLAQVEFEVTP